MSLMIKMYKSLVNFSSVIIYSSPEQDLVGIRSCVKTQTILHSMHGFEIWRKNIVKPYKFDMQIRMEDVVIRNASAVA